MDTRTCERCSHLRTEHKQWEYHGIDLVPSWCHACDCEQFIPEPDDIAGTSTIPEEVA